MESFDQTFTSLETKGNTLDSELLNQTEIEFSLPQLSKS